MQALLLIRDATILCLLWETHSRGDNAGKWRVANLLTAAGEHTTPFFHQRAATAVQKGIGAGEG